MLKLFKPRLLRLGNAKRLTKGDEGIGLEIATFHEVQG